MNLFRKRYEDDDWTAGVPESFKTWFWIRLAVSLYVGYIGGDLIWRCIMDGLAWWYVLLGSAFILVAVIFLILDVTSYIRLKKHLKAKEEAEAAAEAGSQETEEPMQAPQEKPKARREVADGQEMTGIRSFFYATTGSFTGRWPARCTFPCRSAPGPFLP